MSAKALSWNIDFDHVAVYVIVNEPKIIGVPSLFDDTVQTIIQPLRNKSR